jgi:hypothetical protein
MRKPLLAMTLILGSLGMGFAQGQISSEKGKAAIIAFYDEERLRSSEAQIELENFAFFFKQIREIAQRDFPGVEFRILKRGELVYLADGVALNVQNMQPALGYVFSAPGKKHRMLAGPQLEQDFSCAAAAYFERPSRSCRK